MIRKIINCNFSKLTHKSNLWYNKYNLNERRDTLNLKDYLGETNLYDKKEKLERNKPKSWLKSVSAFANGRGGS